LQWCQVAFNNVNVNRNNRSLTEGELVMRLSVIVVSLVLFAAASVHSQIPEVISYQGVLADSTGTVVPDGEYDFSFNVFDAPASGTSLWSESHNSVTVENGVFNILLGSDLPLDLPFDEPYWLGVSVDGEPEMVPRLEFTSSATSLNSRSIADSIVTGVKIKNGNVVRSISGLQDSVTIASGANINVTTSNDSVIISATAGGGIGDGHSLDAADGDPIDALFVDNDGEVGIGTTTPNAAIHAFKDVPHSEFNGLRVENPSAVGPAITTIRIGQNFGGFAEDETGYLAYYGSGEELIEHQGTRSSFAVIAAEGVSGGLTLAADHSSAPIRFFAGGKTFDFQRMRINPDGNVGIGTLTPGNILTIQQGSATDPIADAWTTYSSRRWKTNIKTLDGAITTVERLRGVTFDWKESNKHDIGLIAEEVGEVIPEVVEFEKDGRTAKSVDYARLVAVLIEATKEQQHLIDSLENKIRAQDERISKLEKVEERQSEYTKAKTLPHIR
jgi:hypothetical protein